MFQKPAFGSNSSGFGSFNAGSSTTTPFGGFKTNTGTSAFGAPPAFGASTSTQPATGGGLFGATQPTTSLFGNTAASTSAPPFGASPSGFGFGGGSSTSTGLFAQPANNSGLFSSNQNTSAFGAKPSSFGFGGTSTSATTTGGLFGSTQNTNNSLFGQQQSTGLGTGLFSNTTGTFGQQAATGTGHVKYNPLVGTDVVVKGGTSQNVIIKHHCITCMKEYESKSLEELRLEDYTAGRKGSAGGGMFGGFQQTENKPLFGGSTFGQPATTSAPNVFGGGGALNTSGGFGQTNTFSFGNNAQNTTNTTGLFGTAKPAFGAPATSGTGLFGAASTQASTFGTNTSTFGFGATTQNQTGGLFGAKPATSGFGAPATSGFGGFGAASPAPTLFGAKPQQSAAPAFGTPTPAFGSLSGGFGTTTSTAGGLFGANNTFGKPAAQAPAFGFGTTQQPTLGTGLGSTGLGGAFGQKPATATGFGTLGGTMFQQTNNNTFRTGLDSGLGGGLFNNSSLGGGTLGMGLNTNNSGTVLGNTSTGNVHEQILTLAARPYGDSPLFKNLLPDRTTTAEDVLKPTNPAAVKAALESSGGYRVGSPNVNIKLSVRPATHHDKKSLFDGLEEADASLEDKLSLKPSRKRLVLRQTHRNEEHNSVEQINNNNRSMPEEQPAQTEPAKSSETSLDELERVKRQVDFNEENSLKNNSERHGSWLTSPKTNNNSWSDNEKAAEVGETPRLYPNLDKELPAQTAERRASWLTTKPLRKPVNWSPGCAENSVRELGVRDRSLGKENIDTLSVSEEEHVPPVSMPPHPTGIKLTRPGYYTIPSLDDLTGYLRPDGSCVVPNFTIGRKNYGNVYYDCEMDVAGLDLDALVHFLNKEVIVYPEDADKPPVGEALNRRAIVTLDRVWPRDKTEKRPITDPERLLKMDYEGKLRRVCDKHDTKFIEYRPQTGSWVFRVEHFSKYGLTDSDEEDDITPDVLKRQLVEQQQLQKSAAPAKPKPPAGLGGLGAPGLQGTVQSGLQPGLPLGTLQSISSMPLSTSLLPEHMFAMQSSLGLYNGEGKGLTFEMDTTEDNAESHSMYSDSRALGVKSPTSELARLEHRQSHHVQLMKASLYADAEMEDDVSVSTGDQQVPWTHSPPRVALQSAATVHTASDVTAPAILASNDEIAMKPLIVQPHTIVLKYHRKVPPFKKTIAGRLDAACIADMAVCRARHSRIGFGPAGQFVFPTSLDSLADLPKSAELCDLGRYLGGRREDDWSEPIVARLAVGHGDPSGYTQEALTLYMETLLEWSEVITSPVCPRLAVRTEPHARLQLLLKQREHARALRNKSVQFGVTGEYCCEVWTLCEALWRADLENDGVAPEDVQSRVSQHKRLISWLTDAVKDVTEGELASPSESEAEDDTDFHSGRVWTLLVGGRVLDACKLARKHGDLNMAALIAQAAGDPLFRSLVSRQLTLWRECGAEPLISATRLATMRLVAGLSTPRDKLNTLDWMRALLATAKYICPQVPTLEQVVRTYEGFFIGDDEDADLTTVEDDEMGMRHPVPPYCQDYELASNNGRHRRILDLRYELIKARSRNARPGLKPASYTPDPLDYSLCFLLGTWFGNPTRESITGLADQLESLGAWHLAVQALAYHPDDVARGHLIRGVLSRHAPAAADTEEQQKRMQLVRRLQIPEKWLLLAQAHRAGYMHSWLVQARHLSDAEEWNAAHEVLLDKLLPDAVLGDNMKNVAPLLEKLYEAAQRHEVCNWETGGLALYHYMHVCEQMQVVVSGTESGDVPGRLEALRPLVAAACRALQHLPHRSARHAAARTEMGARLLQLAVAGGERAPRLAALLRALGLPPDCAQHAHRQITNELAEQASELCIDSVSSSPISSQHRAAALS
ncbi:nuclear pore complex protein Nup98-Nup96 isoform X2 [Amyelois transitella]|uniref:nuclear pore complex protein Nup98-Nup96 isoform X2 n=1 Tax=Amyelois transitella TaxID=680683 RepID=UPI00298F6345|nr:nuclear pore complex protein Nup98-Nup96 isoform X2 [Amyelois transitella]